MNQDDLNRVDSLISIGLIALPFQGLASFLTVVFNSKKDTLTPLIINLLGLLSFFLVSGTSLFGSGLDALMWGVVSSYLLISVLQMLCLKIETINWFSILLEKTFIVGLLISTVIMIYVSYIVALAHWPAFLALFVVGICAFLSLCLMALFNQNIRSELKNRLNS